jgi:hypothetical protein
MNFLKKKENTWSKEEQKIVSLYITDLKREDVDM